MSSFISLFNILQFLVDKSFTSLVKLIPKYFILFWCYCKWDCFPNFLFRKSLLVYRNTTDFFLIYLLFIYYLFLAVLGLCFCARAFSSCGKQGPLFIAMHGPLTIAASLVAEHRLQTRRLSSCGSRA